MKIVEWLSENIFAGIIYGLAIGLGFKFGWWVGGLF